MAEHSDDVVAPKVGTNFQSFSRRARTYAEAAERHDMVKKAAEEEAKLSADVAQLLWAAVSGPRQSLESDLDRAVDATIPQAMLLLTRTGDDIPAAAAFALAARAIKDVDPTDYLALRDALEPVWKKLAELDQHASDVEEGFGCDRSDAWRTVRQIRSAPNSAQFTRKMNEIAKLAGAMHASMSTLAGSAESADPHQVDGVERGGDVTRLTGDALTRLATDETADMEAMRVLRSQSEVVKLTGRVKAARGKLVIVLDESSSMHDERHDFRGRNTWAKACALSLARIAIAEGRDVAVLHVSAAVATQERVRTQADLVEMCAHFLGGGTLFVPALRAAAKMAASLNADVVYITDGQQEVHNDAERLAENVALSQILDGMAAANTRLWSVAIGQHFRDDFPLRTRAARYVIAHDSDLRMRKAAVNLAVGLTGAAVKVAREDLN